MKKSEINIGLLYGCLFGIGAYWAWSGASMISATLWQEASNALAHSIWLANTAAHGITLVVFGALSRRLFPYHKKRIVILGAPLLVVFGTVSIAFLYGTPFFENLSVLGAFIAGIGTAGIFVLWAEVFSKMEDSFIQRFTLAGSVVCGLLMIIIIVCLPWMLSLPLTIMLPVVSVICIMKASDSAYQPESEKPSRSGHITKSGTQKGALVRLLLCCFVFAIPTGLFQNRYTNTSAGSTVEVWGTIFSCVLVLVGVFSFLDYLFSKKHDSSIFSKLIIPFIAGGLLVFPFFASGIELGAGVLILTGYHMFLIYIYTDFSTISVDTDMLPIRIFTFGTCVIDLGLVVGSLLVESVNMLSAEWFVGMVLGVVYLLILVGLLLFPKIAERIVNRNSDIKAVQSLQRTDIPDAFSRFKERCRVITERYGLSSREEEVLSYLLRGRNLQSIASETFLSYNTVKTHVSHIYQKLNIHTRKELIDVFEWTKV